MLAATTRAAQRGTSSFFMDRFLQGKVYGKTVLWAGILDRE
jgi:hypothetical protein